MTTAVLQAQTRPAAQALHAAAVRRRPATLRHDALLLLAIVLGDQLQVAYVWLADPTIGPLELVTVASYLLITVMLSLCSGILLLLGARRLAGWSVALPWHLGVTAAFVLMLNVLRAAPWLLGFGLPRMMHELGIWVPAESIAFLWFYTGLIVDSFVIAYEASRRRRDEAMLRLAALQRTQREAEQRIATARLRALQGRVDPQHVSQLLAAVGDAYRDDAARAETLLDSLIAFLRLSTSRTREQSPTLGQELALAGAYQRLRALARLPSVALDARAAEAAGDAAFPAGALLALLDEVQRAGHPGPLTLLAARGDGWLRVEGRLAGPLTMEALSAARALVEDAEGRVTVRKDAAAWRVTMEVPDGQG